MPAAETTQSLWYHWRPDGCPAASYECGIELHFSACGLQVQFDDLASSSNMTPADCAALQRWLDSQRLSAALADGPCVLDDSGPAYEITQTTHPDGTCARMDARALTGEPYDTHRACMHVVLTTYFPGRVWE